MTGSPSFDGLAVVVVNYGASDLLADGLVAVSRDLPGADVIVVDNLSTQSERASITELAATHGWALVPAAENLGFGAGCNLGAATAWGSGATRVLLLNPDATIDSASVGRLEDAIAADPRALVAPVVRRPDGSIWTAGNRLDPVSGRMIGRTERPGEGVLWLSGACLMLTHDLWDHVGGFDDDYFLYWEDVDLSARVTAAGGRLRVLDDAVAVHLVGGTQPATAGRARSPLYYYFNIRNRQLFADRHLDPELRRRWRRSSLAAAREVLLRGGRRQFLRPVPVLRIAWRGLRDARRGRWGRGPF